LTTPTQQTANNPAVTRADVTRHGVAQVTDQSVGLGHECLYEWLFEVAERAEHASAGCHSDGTVEAYDLTVEHRVLDDVDG
jgi:hypothetical protein